MLTVVRKCLWAFLLLPSLQSRVVAQEEQRPSLSEMRKYEGLIIDTIQFEPQDQPLTAEQLRKRLPLHPGSIFSEHGLRGAIEALFSSGRYSDLAVDASANGSKVSLRFVTKRAYFVGRVVVTGVKQPPNSGQLSSATKLRLGQSYRDSDKTQALNSLQDLLIANGFYHAHVDAETAYHRHTERADLTFTWSPVNAHGSRNLRLPDILNVHRTVLFVLPTGNVYTACWVGSRLLKNESSGV